MVHGKKLEILDGVCEELEGIEEEGTESVTEFFTMQESVDEALDVLDVLFERITSKARVKDIPLFRLLSLED